MLNYMRNGIPPTGLTEPPFLSKKAHTLVCLEKRKTGRNWLILESLEIFEMGQSGGKLMFRKNDRRKSSKWIEVVRFAKPLKGPGLFVETRRVFWSFWISWNGVCQYNLG